MRRWVMGLAAAGVWCGAGLAAAQTASQPGVGNNQPKGAVRISGTASGTAAQTPKHPPTLWGDPYDRSQGSLGTVRIPKTPPKPEPMWPQSFAAWLKQNTMTGDWGGARTRLEDEGIAFQGRYFEDAAGNPVGGRSKAVRYAHEVGLGADVNFAQLTGTDYGVFHVLLTERAGLGLGATLPALNSPQEIFGSGETVRFTRLSWEKQLGRYADGEIGWINMSSPHRVVRIVS